MSKLKISGQEGRALVLTLIALAVGCLLILPFLSYISTNLLATRATEEGMKGLYAADAGIEYAIRKIKNGDSCEGEFNTPTLVNGMPVTVTVGTEGGGVYKVITSTATSVVDGSSITIVSHVSLSSLNLSWLKDSAITSNTNITLMPNTVISGNVTYGGSITGEEHIEEPYTATLDSSIQEKWPTADELSGFYWEDVKNSQHYPDGTTIDLKDTNSIGPLYGEGNLYIDNTGSETTAALEGTVYVAGNLEFRQAGGPHAYTIDLNGQTMYAEGDITFPSDCTIVGSGCIIAKGNVTFQPKVSTSPDDFVFVMSIEGTACVQPNGSLYGAVAGDAEVDLMPGCTLTWTGGASGGELNFPDGSSGTFKIHTYNINP